MKKILDVYLHDILAGELIQDASGTLSFAYDSDYIENKYPAISISMPVQKKRYPDSQTRAFFSGLLPENLLRSRLAKYLGVSEKNSFALLEAVGGECAGALSLYSHGDDISRVSSQKDEILNDNQLENILHLLQDRPLLAGNDGLRLSLAGAQDKIAVGVTDQQIVLLKGNKPTTHILKPLIQNIEDSTHNELFCMKLAEKVGIKTPPVHIRYVKDMPYFLVERYDRILDSSGNIKRLHQEDFCQALGLFPEIKYEREGGPSLKTCSDLITRCVAKPAFDQKQFLKRIIFNYLIGNADAHGKNFSFLYRNRTPELAPAYDLLSTAVYSNLDFKMAMKIGGQYDPNKVFLRHWERIVSDTNTAKKNLYNLLKNTAKQTKKSSEELILDLKKQGITSGIIDKIVLLIKQRSDRLLNLL